MEPLAPYQTAPSALLAAIEARPGTEWSAYVEAVAQAVEEEARLTVADEIRAGLLDPLTRLGAAAELDAGPACWREALATEAVMVALYRLFIPTRADHRALDAIRRANPTGVAEASLAALDQSGALDRLTSGKTCRANFG